MSEQILRKPEVMSLIRMKNTWLYEAIKSGDFPAPIRLGKRAVGWRRSDIDEWLASREKAVS